MLVFNSATKIQLSALAKDMPQALLLSGAPGVGLFTAARYLAGDNLATIIEPLDKDGASNHQKGSISVGRIRQLYDETRGKSTVPRIYIIDDADKLTASAANAFLKLLEEPNQNTHFLLTTHQPGAILGTILSRTQHITVLPITAVQSDSLMLNLKLTGAAAKQAAFLAAGRPAELSRLAADKTYFDSQIALMAAAKQFLNGSTLQKVQTVFSFSQDRDQALALIAACIHILQFSVNTSPSPDTIGRIARLVRVFDTITANGNVKLQLTAALL